MNRQPSRQAAQKFSSLRTLCLCVRSSGSFPPTPIVSTAYGHTSITAVPQLLCNQSVTHSFHHDGGIPPSLPCLRLSNIRNSTASTVSGAILFLFTLLRTLLHPEKTQLFSFHTVPHSLPKTTRGGGTPSLEQEQNENSNCQFRRSTLRWPHRTPGGRQAVSVGMPERKEQAREKIIGWAAGK